MRRTLAVLVTGVLISTSCQNLEEYLPAVVIAGGAAATVLALNYYDDPTYMAAAVGVLGTLTTYSYAAADSFVERRRKDRELAELQEIEREIKDGYAEVEREDSAASGNEWTSAAAVPGSTAGPGNGWTTADAQTGTASMPSLPTPGQAIANSPWGDRYRGPSDLPQPGSSQPQPRDAGGARIAIDVALLKHADGASEVLAQNAVLFDGIGDDPTRDELRVFFRPTHDAYVYVVSVDSVGRVQPLFPNVFPDRVNPVQAGRAVLLPGGDEWYRLDAYAGLEQVYFYAGPEPREDLVADLSRLASLPRPQPSGEVHTVSEPTLIETPELKTRGLVAGRPIVEASLGDGGAERVEVARYTAPAPGESVAATWVFEHK